MAMIKRLYDEMHDEVTAVVQESWDNAIGESWSLASIGLVTIFATVITIKHPPKTEEE